MTEINAKVIADSVSLAGKRLTTMEVTYHRYVHSELMTHRTFCLAGDSILEFDLPAGTSRNARHRRSYKVRISDFVDRWHHGANRVEAKPKRSLDLSMLQDDVTYRHSDLARQVGYTKSGIAKACRDGILPAIKGDDRTWLIKGLDFKEWRLTRPENTRFDISDRLAAMQIRQLNERTGLIQTSNVVACCFSGDKSVYQVQAGKHIITGSAEHRLWTPEGYRTIGELSRGDEIVVQRKGKRDEDSTLDQFRQIDGQWRAPWQRQQRARLLAEYGCCQKCDSTDALQIHHIIEVRVDPSKAFDESNILLLCEECHKAQHRVQGWQAGQYLYGDTIKIERVVRAGVEPTFDLEIAGEFPNFIANGVVVHNSRNAASSRAISFKKMLQRVQDDPAIPISFPAEQPGMQGGGELQDLDRMYAEAAWLGARDQVVKHAQELHERGVHKSVCNRLLEPFAWMTVIISSTEWDNFFNQRCSPLAMPELRVAAECMRDALCGSTPVLLDFSYYHTPYVTIDEVPDLKLRKKVSTARCARVSYLTHDGVRDISKDLELFERLKNDGHMSPFEHVARPGYFNKSNQLGNFDGWIQLRHEVFGW